MTRVAGLVDALGDSLLRLVVAGEGSHVNDVTVQEPDELEACGPGDFVLGVAVTGPDQAIQLVEEGGRSGAAGVVLKSHSARDPRVIATAERLGVALVELRPQVSWTHLVWLLRSVIDRAAAPGASLGSDLGVHGELFAIADAAAAIAEAPVTIEDPHSRVLAYSAGQELTDPARVSTIVGRRVPEKIVAHQRASGVFRKLTRSSSPIYLPATGSEHLIPRLIIPARAAGEWLGSIWVVAAGPIAAERVEQLTKLAAVLALHLLRLRAQADMSQRASTDRVRSALRSTSPPAHIGLWLPTGPWRVVALGVPTAIGDAGGMLDLWDSITRRFGWKQPLLADLDGIAFAVVLDDGDPSAPGTLSWLRALIDSVHPRDDQLTAAIGGLATNHADLRRSRIEAAEVCQLLASRRLTGPIVQIDEAWSTVTIARAGGAILPEKRLLGPLPALIAHDREHGTTFVSTLSAWLDYMGDPRAAAASLDIHPNTLRHRVHRIAEMTPVDLAAPPVRLAFQLQIAALESTPSDERLASSTESGPG